MDNGLAIAFNWEAFFIPAFFHQSEIHFFLKFIISSLIVTIICFWTYHYFVRKTFIGKFLNGKTFTDRVTEKCN